VKYSRKQIVLDGNLLTTFPHTTIYDLNANDANFTENISTEAGGFQSAQSLSYQLKKINQSDNLRDFVNLDWRFIVKDNNGLLRMVGLYNSITGGFLKDIGTNKSDFNGFKFTFETKEEYEAPFLSDLSMFNIYNPITPNDQVYFDYKERVESTGGTILDDECAKAYFDELLNN
tara:strand:+ start:321 stop:842 length:522 start_codon:yes stop_codon:yes gene_type:complete